MSARGFAGALIVVLLSATSWAGTKLPTVTHDGRSYVELSRVAASLHTKLDATPASTRAHLRTRDKTVTFTRNWSQVLVNGKPVMLDAPVRVKQGVWLVPESFMGQVVPTLVTGASAGAAPVRQVAAPAEVTLEDVRVRSYPSFTRIVVETSAAVPHRIESSGPKEARVRLLGLGNGAQVEGIHDGLIAEVRLERAGADGLLRVVYEGAAGTIKPTQPAAPPRARGGGC